MRSVIQQPLRSGMSAGGLKRQVLGRLRGDRRLEQLVAEGLELGKRVSVGRRAYLDPGRPWLITIGDESIIADFAIVMTHDPRTKFLIGATRLGRVVIGRRVFVGHGAIILPGTRIGDDCVIDTRAVVSGEIPPGSFVTGNPGRVAGDVKAMADSVRQAATGEPTGPHDGSSSQNGSTVGGNGSRPEALGVASEGYVPAGPRRR